MFEKHKCTICGRSEPEVSFYFRKLRPSSYCKDDERKKSREAKKARYHDPVKGISMKASAAIRYADPEHKEKVNAYQKNKYATDVDFRESLKLKLRAIRASPEGGKKIRIRAAKYYQENKKKIRVRLEEKKIANPKLRIRGFMRGRINEAMKSHGLSKGGTPSLQYLPYTWDDMYRHLELQFEDWMTFSNYGAYDSIRKTWQIDHIIPQAFFPYDSMDSRLFRWCWSLSNLRPLESLQNLREGSREDILGPERSIDVIFSEIRDVGIPQINVESVQSLYDVLSKVPPAMEVCAMGMHGLSYLDRMFTGRFDSKTARFPSVIESMRDDDLMFRTILHIVKKGSRVTPGSVFSNLKFVSRTPGHFFPSSAISILKAHLPTGGKFFDPFLGWGGRTLGALCSNASRIVGCDLQLDVVENCKLMANDFSSLSHALTDFHCTDSLSYLRQSNEKFDLIFSSPPFMDTENYGVESDSMRQGWLDDFIFPFAEECRRHITPYGKVALHLKDLKGAATFTAYHAAMKSAGFKQIARHRYGRTWMQAVYIYSI